MKKTLLSALLLGAANVFAAESIVGDWRVDPDNEAGPYMFSMNESASAFGKWCADGTCYWMLITKSSCNNDGGQVPALISSDAGVKAIELKCIGAAPNIAGSYRWVLINPDEIDRVVSTSRRVGIAYAIQETNFAVARFGTTSFPLASQRLTTPTLTKQKQQAGPKNRTEVL